MNYKELSDEQLVDYLKRDDASAFEEIYNRYWYKLFEVAYHQVGTKEEAEELVHDLFESIWNRRTQAVVRHLKTYLVVAIKHLSTNHIKSRITHRKFQEYLIFQEIQQVYSTEEVVNFADLSGAIEEVMKKLPEKTIAIFKMSRFEHQSVKDISEQMNLSEKAVEYHITKSIKVFRKHLKGYQFSN